MDKEKTKILKEKYAGSYIGKHRNLTEKQIRESSAMELCIRLSKLNFNDETDTHTLEDLREIKEIEKEMRRKLVKMLGRDFYPPGYPLQHDNTS